MWLRHRVPSIHSGRIRSVPSVRTSGGTASESAQARGGAQPIDLIGTQALEDELLSPSIARTP
jgi:hypothetical protein